MTTPGPTTALRNAKDSVPSRRPWLWSTRQQTFSSTAFSARSSVGRVSATCALSWKHNRLQSRAKGRHRPWPVAIAEKHSNFVKVIRSRVKISRFLQICFYYCLLTNAHSTITNNNSNERGQNYYTTHSPDAHYHNYQLIQVQSIGCYSYSCYRSYVPWCELTLCGNEGRTPDCIQRSRFFHYSCNKPIRQAALKVLDEN